MKQSSIKQKLTNYGLTSRQADIYLILLKSSDMRIRDLVEQTKLPRSTIYEDIKSLCELGLVEWTIHEHHKKLKAYPLSILKHRIHKSIVEAEYKLDEIDLIEGSIDKLVQPGQVPAVQVKYFEGVSGARQLFWNTLKASSELYVYSEWGRGKYVGIDFYKRFVEESRVRQVREKVITNSDRRVIDSISKYADSPVSRTKIDTIRMVSSSEVELKGETLIYDDVYAQVFLKGEVISGFEVHSSEFVKTQRALFEKLWQSAQPCQEYLKNKIVA